ncbi:MAG: ATP-binding cassette domain-containing protein, partial [DPANN group archaeon]|nr:ATP-binding cassette domain-containing protein [DPANN group archaeon]
MNEVILKVKNLSVDFAGKAVLQNIGFEVRRGEILSIIGPNGAGKSVLLKTILGLFPHKGKITLEPHARIGYVPQKIDVDQYTKLTVGELFEIKRKILKLPEKD